MTEGRATGIPTIQKALKDNGSASAVIDTDNDRTYFLLTIPRRKGFENVAVSMTDNQNIRMDSELLQILGQSSVKVQEYVNQSIISDKIQLLQILLQISVKV